MAHHAEHQVALVTNAPNSPHDDRVSRMIRYAISMALRIVCILLLFVVPGWWKMLPLVGAAILPLYAVVIANLPKRVNSRFESVVDRAIAADASTPTADPGFVVIDLKGPADDESPRAAEPDPRDAWRGYPAGPAAHRADRATPTPDIPADLREEDDRRARGALPPLTRG